MRAGDASSRTNPWFQPPLSGDLSKLGKEQEASAAIAELLDIH